MNLEEFAKKYLDIELKHYQLEWIRQLHKHKYCNYMSKHKGRKHDLVLFDDIKEIEE